MRHLCQLLAGCAIVGLCTLSAAAQIDPLGGLNFGGPGASSAQPITVSAEIRQATDGKPVLAVTAAMAQDYHIYSVTQPPGGCVVE